MVRWLPRLAVLLLALVIASMAGVSLWLTSRTELHVEELERTHRTAGAYEQAIAEAVQAETALSAWVQSGDRNRLDEVLLHDAAFEAKLREAASAGGADPFAVALVGYVGRFHAVLVDMAASEGDPATVMAQHSSKFDEAVAALIASVERGDLGDPGPILTQLQRASGRSVPPADGSGPSPAPNLRNPVPAILAPRILQEQTEAAAAAAGIHRAIARERTLTIVFYGVGVVVVLLLGGAAVFFARREAMVRYENEQLRRVVRTDPLTGLSNRRAFEEISEAFASDPQRDQPGALVMLDLDEFKEVNDVFGHDRGDSVLRCFATMLRRHAPPGTYAFRIGGDEFAMILPALTAEAAAPLLERMRLAAETGLGHNVTMSAGVATIAPGDGDHLMLRQRADAALYDAKLRGRNVVALHDPDRDESPVFPAAKLAAVRRLLVDCAVEAVFQPVWDLCTGELIAYEALARPGAEYGIDGPQQAFEIAERFGRAADLDQICRHAILDAAASLPVNARILINISPYTLTHRSFAPIVLLQELRAANVQASRVVLEITERSQVAPAAIAERVAELRTLGFRVALDHAGAGTSGLGMLRRIPFEYVKLDRALVMSATGGGSGRAALMAILAFAAESNSTVIAEGIEDERMLTVVREVARTGISSDAGLIHGVQGYLLGRPTPAEEAAEATPPSLAA